MGQRLCPVIVGRDPELEVLRASLQSALNGRGNAVVLVGEAGIGKSRLCRQVSEWAAGRSVALSTGRGAPASTSSPYRPITEALLQLLRDGRREAALREHDMKRWLPFLAPVLPLHASEHRQPAEVMPSLRAEAVVQVLRRLAPEGLVLLLEDLHWADPDTLSVVDYLARNIGDMKLLVVMTLRDTPETAALEMARRLRGLSNYIALDRLTPVHLAEMVRACDPAAPEQMVDRIQDASDGIPLLVEELLVSPGLPDGFAATVRARLGDMSAEHRLVIEAAAVLGRRFDWALLGPMSGLAEEEISSALSHGVDLLLLMSGGTTLRFRHALTREAVLDTLIPPRQRELAGSALAAIDRDPGAYAPDLVIDLAVRAGERHRAGALLRTSGIESLRWGALSTAAATFRRAAHLLSGHAEQSHAELDLIDALALAGRVDESAAIGGKLITRLGSDPTTTELRVEVHLRLAQAAVAASRWQMARHHLSEARALTTSFPTADADARASVLEADVMMSSDDYDGARKLAQTVIDSSSTSPSIRCHAFEIVGRSLRSGDLQAARGAFESALVTAEAADLAVWRLRALHELGTIDLFDHAGVERLIEAREAAERMGALGTAAVLDLQLSAGFTGHWNLERVDLQARSSLNIAEKLGLDQIRAKAFAMLAGSASMRADVEATDRYMASALAATPDDRMLKGFGLGSRGLAVLLAGEPEDALGPYTSGMLILGELPHAEPAALRSVWPLILAARGDDRARSAIDEAHELGVAAFRLNSGIIGIAEAVLAGRRGDRDSATQLVTNASAAFVNCEPWADLALWLAAPSALDDGWGSPAEWLAMSAAGFEQRGLPAAAQSCRGLLREQKDNPWESMGVSAREADVLRLVIRGMANRAIAAELHLSSRTVEKHVESILRKTGSRSRTELVARLAASGPGKHRAGPT